MNRLRALLSALIYLIGCGFVVPAFAQKQIAQPPTPAEAPFSLTAADGTGLKLVSVDAQAVVDGPLAFTELKLVFENPLNRTIEGRFNIVMPDGAAISRFAMKIQGKWMEGEVVEKQAARRAYEDALHQRRDPALLEQDAGNAFRARVFPINARERKELIISWSNNLTKAGESYRLPLKGLPKIERLELRALTAANSTGAAQSSLGGQNAQYQVTAVSKTDFTPDQDWVITGGKMAESGEALRQGNLMAARFVVPVASEMDEIPHAVLMVDTSASRAIDFDQRIETLAAMVKELGSIGIQRIQVIAYDQTSQAIFDGAPSDFGATQIKSLKARSALGSSSLTVALDALKKTSGSRRVIFFTDGVVTAGEQDSGALKARLMELASQDVQRIDAIVDTTARDTDRLNLLVQTLSKRGRVIEGRDALPTQLTSLSRTTLNDIKVEVPGAKWVWPQTLVGVQAGDIAVVFADVPATAKAEIQLSGGMTGIVTPEVRPAQKPLLERAWIQARIQRLEGLRAESDPDLKEAMKQQIITLSTRHRVLSPYTALVVLETEADYVRFNIQRNALADILTVGSTGVELIKRNGVVIRTPPPIAKDSMKESKSAKKSVQLRENAPTPVPEAAAAGSTEVDFQSAPEAVLGNQDGFGGQLNAPMAGAGDGGLGLSGTGSGGGGRVHGLGRSRPRSAQPEARARERARAIRSMERRNQSMLSTIGASSDSESAVDILIGADSASLNEAMDEAPSPSPRTRTGSAGSAPRVARRRARRPARRRGSRPPQIASSGPNGRQEYEQISRGRPSLTGKMASIDALIAKNQNQEALKAALAWRTEAPTELLPLVALGRAYLAAGQTEGAARAFGSILDLFPSRADMRRMAGNWLELCADDGLALAADTYRVAMEQRPDHPSVYHQLSMVLVRLGQHADAFEVLETGLKARRVGNRFPGVDRILKEDMTLVGQAWIAAEPARKNEIVQRLSALQLSVDSENTLRFVLTWETDANDVDFHIFDDQYNHAYYSRKNLPNDGGQLYADVTTGYGPECFTIKSPKKAPYRLKAHYYRRGPMGYGAGKLQVIRHDGKGGLSFEDRPFVIMQDGAYVDLGQVTQKTARIAQ